VAEPNATSIYTTVFAGDDTSLLHTCKDTAHTQEGDCSIHTGESDGR
jgi:hypothetical protein